MKKFLIILVVFVLTLPILAYAEATAPTMQPIDLTPIFQALITLLATVITVKVIPWIKSKTTNEQQAALLATVKTLVYAAEQLYGAGKGIEKLAWVETTLQAKGYMLDTDLIKEMIESQVRELTMKQGMANQ